MRGMSMSNQLLTEVAVLVKMGWPSRRYLDARIRRERFPLPRRQSHGIGDQWLEADIDRWMGVGEDAQADGRQRLIERFAAGS